MSRAVLIKLKSADGLMVMNDDIELGKVYDVDLYTRQMIRGVHLPTGRLWEREMVWENTQGWWFPTELLRFEELNS